MQIMDQIVDLCHSTIRQGDITYFTVVLEIPMIEAIYLARDINK